MHEKKWLAEQFEANRAHLRAVAYRMLGSRAEAEDAVQEAWLRLSRSDTSEVDNLTGWLTTVVARVSLKMLQARGRRAEPVDELPRIVDRTPTATRQLASRARRRVRGAEPPEDVQRRQEVVRAFLAASR